MLQDSSNGNWTLKLCLSDWVVKLLYQQLWRYDLPVETLIEKFINDLIGDGHGADEEMYARLWLERTCLKMRREPTFLSYLIQHGELEYALQGREVIQENTRLISDLKKALEQGKYEGIVDDVKEEIISLQKDVAYYSREIDKCWAMYKERYPEPPKKTLDEEMNDIQRWIKNQRQLFDGKVLV